MREDQLPVSPSVLKPATQGRYGSRGLLAQTRKALRKPQFWFGAMVLIPTLLYYWVFSFGPIIQAFMIAIKDYRLLEPATSPFVGLDNFRSLVQISTFLPSVTNTITWAALTFVFALPLALLISVCLASVTRGRNWYQGLIFLPVVVSLVAIALMFRMLMDPEVGQFNRILRSLHLPESRWLSDTESALITAAGIGVWKGLGFNVVILTAGIMNIPTDIYDAALVDGAGWWARFWRVTLPLLAHTLLLITILMTIGSLQEFTLPFVLTNGGPGTSTYTYNMLIYNEAFVKIRFGVASAAALLQFLVIVVISLLQLRLFRPNWSY
jgi:multiple sugar transport system permease protein